MSASSNIQEELIREHASLICAVVDARYRPEHRDALLADLDQAEQNGWGKLCAAIRLILVDEVMDMEGFDELNLDVEDEAIVQAMILGIHDPDTLPDPSDNENPMLAPSGLAGIIATAATGEENALQLLAKMDDDLSQSDDEELVAFGRILRRLLNGERHAQSLSMGLNERTQTLVYSVLEELNKLDNQSH